nr:hypothetical protein [Tanacetum cinerariifolium]
SSSTKYTSCRSYSPVYSWSEVEAACALEVEAIGALDIMEALKVKVEVVGALDLVEVKVVGAFDLVKGALDLVKVE